MAERHDRPGETVAALFLRLKGHRILETRLSTPVGKIDLIASRGRVIAFVEVDGPRPARLTSGWRGAAIMQAMAGATI